MNRKYYKEILLVGLGIVLILSGVSYFSQKSLLENNSSLESNLEEVETVQVTLSIDELYDQKQVTVEKGTTILNLLETMNQEDERVQLGTKAYADFGVLVESIGNLSNGTDNKYWQYNVNGVAPMVGADAYLLNGGEEVEWNFTASEF